MQVLKFTPAEAAVITGMPIKAINKAIEKKTVSVNKVKGGSRSGQRLLDLGSLVCLSLESKGVSEFPPKVRRRLYRAVTRAPRQKQIREGEAVIIDVDKARREVTSRMRDLSKAKRMVTSTTDILGGTPVFRGTRIPVYPIADMLQAGVPVTEILDGYPSLTEERIRLSVLYAKAVPRRGRPPVQPWSNAKPVRPSRKVALAER